MDLDAPFPCPECKRQVKASLRDWAASKTVKCPSGHAIKLEGRQAKGAQKSLDDLEKTLKKLGK